MTVVEQPCYSAQQPTSVCVATTSRPAGSLRAYDPTFPQASATPEDLVSVELAKQKLWGVTTEYENILKLQKKHQALILRQQQSEIAYLRITADMLSGSTPEEDDSIAARLEAKEAESEAALETKQHELQLLEAVLRLRESQVVDLERMCQAEERRRSQVLTTKSETLHDGEDQHLESEVESLRQRARSLQAALDDRCVGTYGTSRSGEKIQALGGDLALRELKNAKLATKGDPRQPLISQMPARPEPSVMFAEHGSELRSEANLGARVEDTRSKLAKAAQMLGQVAARNAANYNLFESFDQVSLLQPTSALGRDGYQDGQQEELPLAETAAACLSQTTDIERSFLAGLEHGLNHCCGANSDNQQERSNKSVELAHQIAVQDGERDSDPGSLADNTTDHYDASSAQMKHRPSNFSGLSAETSRILAQHHRQSFAISDRSRSRSSMMYQMLLSPTGQSDSADLIAEVKETALAEKVDFDRRASRLPTPPQLAIAKRRSSWLPAAPPMDHVEEVLPPGTPPCSSQVPCKALSPSKMSAALVKKRHSRLPAPPLDMSLASNVVQEEPDERMSAKLEAISEPQYSQSSSDDSSTSTGSAPAQDWRPHPEEVVDAAVSSFVALPMNRLRGALLRRLAPGRYLYGTQQMTLRVMPELLQRIEELDTAELVRGLEAFDENTACWLPVEAFVRRLERAQSFSLQRARQRAGKARKLYP